MQHLLLADNGLSEYTCKYPPDLIINAKKRGHEYYNGPDFSNLYFVLRLGFDFPACGRVSSELIHNQRIGRKGWCDFQETSNTEDKQSK